MAKNIDTKLKTIQGIFSNSQDSILGNAGIYTIPDFQRAYNWRFNEQCDKLWQDIESFIDNEKNETYFFGSIIINSNDSTLDIIDGQQRVTTFLLLLKALLLRISDELQKLSADEDIDSLRDALKNRRREIISCLYSIDEDDVSLILKGNKLLSELAIKYENKSINEEYPQELKTILHGQNWADIERNVKTIKYKRNDNKYTNFYRNFKFFAEKLDSFGSPQINKFAKTFLKQCQVIVIISYQTDEAIEIFNSLNSTGMPLADADIISAELHKNSGADKTGFNNSWRNIRESTNSLSARKICTIDDILNQYMYILRARNSEKSTTLPGVRRYFTSLDKELLRNPEVFISDLQKIIDIWQDEEDSTELAALKQILFKHNNNFKFFYAAYFFFNRDEPTEQKQQFAEALLKLFAILSIKEYGYSSSLFKAFLFELNVEIGAGASTDVIVQKIRNHIKDPSKFSQKDIYQAVIESNPSNAAIFLNEYLFAKEIGSAVDFNVPKIEIEHIMPGSGRNVSAIREDANLNEDEFHDYVNKIGNKILLEQPINGALSNDWFKVKKQQSVENKRGYKDSVFPIAQSLLSYPKDKWEKEDIDKATRKAAERITNFIFS